MHIHYLAFSAMVKYDAREENKIVQISSTRLTRNTTGNMGRKGGRPKGKRKEYWSLQNQASKRAINSTQYLLSQVKNGQSCLFRIIATESIYSYVVQLEAN